MNKAFLLIVSVLFFACSNHEHDHSHEHDHNHEHGHSHAHDGHSGHDHDHPVTIAFGSCNKTDGGQEIWETILANKPNLWIWTGDIIYGDTDNMEVLKEKYNKQKRSPEYADFRSNIPIIGIWDDHDYGVNDGDKTYLKKAESRDLLFDFLDVPKTNEAWNREGAYQSNTFGLPGEKVKIILLDTRYFRDALIKDDLTAQRYLPNETGDILGEDQWNWLEKELTDSEAETHIIVSSIQIIPTEQHYEKWANFPTARKRLLNLIEELKPNNPIFLSGDRHMAEISVLESDQFEYDLYEITSSGLTHTWQDTTDREVNQFRIKDQIVRENFGLLRLNHGRIEAVEIRSPENELLLEHKLK